MLPWLLVYQFAIAFLLSKPLLLKHGINWCGALLWILSASAPCGFFPLTDSVLSVLFSDAVDSLHFAAVWILLMTPGYQLSVTPLSS